LNMYEPIKITRLAGRALTSAVTIPTESSTVAGLVAYLDRLVKGLGGDDYCATFIDGGILVDGKDTTTKLLITRNIDRYGNEKVLQIHERMGGLFTAQWLDFCHDDMAKANYVTLQGLADIVGHWFFNPCIPTDWQ